MQIDCVEDAKMPLILDLPVENDKDNGTGRSKKVLMIKLAAKRIKMAKGPISVCLENLSKSLQTYDVESFMFTMMQLSSHFGSIGAQRC